MTHSTLQPPTPPPGSFAQALAAGGIQNDPSAPLGTVTPIPSEGQPPVQLGAVVTTPPPLPQQAYPAQQWNGQQPGTPQQGVPGVGTANVPGSGLPSPALSAEQMVVVQQSLKEREELVRSQVRRDLEAQQQVIGRLQAENATLTSENTDTQARLRALETQNLPQEEKQRLAFNELKASNSALSTQLSTLEQQRQADLEAFNRQVEMNRLSEYRVRRVSEMAGFIEPELQDLVQGNTVEEVEASLTRAMQRSSALRSRMVAQQPMATPPASPAAPVTQPQPMQQPVPQPPNLLMHPDTWQRLSQGMGAPQQPQGVVQHQQPPMQAQPPMMTPGAYTPQPGVYPPGSVPVQPVPQMGTSGGQQQQGQPAGFARQVAASAGFEGVRPGGAYHQNRDAIFQSLTGEGPQQIRGRLGGGV